MLRLKENITRSADLVLDYLWDAVFPRFCTRCGKEGSLLCDVCHVDWEPQPLPPACGVCGAPSPIGRSCTAHDDKLAGLSSTFAYADPVARKLITAWKYHFDTSAWGHLRTIASSRLDTLRHILAFTHIEAVVPIPLHSHRLCERGFDQSERVASFIASQVEKSFADLLIRFRSTGKQAERQDVDRQHTMAESPFFVRQNVQIPKRILLVDDVWTTGATAGAAVRALRDAGAELIWVYTLAKGR